VSTLIAYLTEQTCGESCWHAKEDICRCSCGGKNHGCLRDENGNSPVRTSKIDGYRYELQAVGYHDVETIAREINRDAGIGFHYAATSRDADCRGIPAKLRRATDSQVQRWPELAAYRDDPTSDPDQSPETYRYFNPYPDLLWVRID
jgi:hypothetical protein